MAISKEKAQELYDAGEIPYSQYISLTTELSETSLQRTTNTKVNHHHSYGEGRPYAPYNEVNGSRTAIIFSEFIPNNTELIISSVLGLKTTFIEFYNGNRFEFQGKSYTLTELDYYLRKEYGSDVAEGWATVDGLVPVDEWNKLYPKKEK